MTINLTAKRERVLRAVALRPQTPNEFVTTRRLYVNSWAPTFTFLKKAELIEETGETRTTTYGRQARVYRATDAGHAVLQGLPR